VVEVFLLETRAKILLVEDEPLISEVAAEALEEQGFIVDAVANAFDALRRLQRGPTVDILFTDINLPGGMDGTALARRARELRPDLPVIYTSGSGAATDLPHRVEGAMFVSKPYDLFNLGRLVRHLVAASRMRVGAALSA